MKKIVTSFFIFFFIQTNAQYSKSGIVDGLNLKSSQIYNQSKEWFFTNFKSAKAVIEVDVINEKLMGKATTIIAYNTKSGKYIVPIQKPMDLNITIDIKEGKYRYNIETQFKYYNEEEITIEMTSNYIDSILKITPGSGIIGNKGRQELKETTRLNLIEESKQIRDRINGLEQILKSSIKINNDNW